MAPNNYIGGHMDRKTDDKNAYDTQTDKKQKTSLQWHPAFYAGIQIEFEEEADKLIFENEHQLGTKPKEIDVLIIKKNPKEQIRKNIGRIFRRHNIVEYKGPDDYLSIDDFYQVYGYACFYKADTVKANSIPIHDISITFVCHRYPRKLIRHLTLGKKLVITKYEPGIYYIQGDTISMQLIITSQLPDETNLWLHNLTNNIKDTETAKKLVAEYGKHQNENLYKSLMNIIVQANREKFGTEDKNMCEALMEIIADKIIEKEQLAEQRGLERGLEQGLEQGLERGRIELERLIDKYIKNTLRENTCKENILTNLHNIFDISTKQAEEYFAKYAHEVQ